MIKIQYEKEHNTESLFCYLVLILCSHLMCPVGDHDGPPSADHLVHSGYREHRGADGPAQDASDRLPGELGGLRPGPRREAPVQDDLPRV